MIGQCYTWEKPGALRTTGGTRNTLRLGMFGDVIRKLELMDRIMKADVYWDGVQISGHVPELSAVCWVGLKLGGRTNFP